MRPVDDVVKRGPRNDTIETVFTAAFRLLIDEGAHAITAHRLHRETGIARTTIYRHWPEPADLLASMLERATGDQDMGGFVGEVRADLTTAVDALVFRFNERPVRAMFGALVELGRREPGEGDVAAGYVDGIVRAIRQAIAEGVERGELVGSPERLDAMVAELTGPLMFEHVLRGHTVTEADGRRAVDEFVSRYARRS